jgi:hypothetical protein
MARIITLRCDLCKQPTEKIVGKMYFAPMIANDTRSPADKGNYTHFMHVGACCYGQLKKLKWNKRRRKEEYLDSAVRQQGGRF